MSLFPLLISRLTLLKMNSPVFWKIICINISYAKYFPLLCTFSDSTSTGLKRGHVTITPTMLQWPTLLSHLSGVALSADMTSPPLVTTKVHRASGTGETWDTVQICLCTPAHTHTQHYLKVTERTLTASVVSKVPSLFSLSVFLHRHPLFKQIIRCFKQNKKMHFFTLPV